MPRRIRISHIPRNILFPHFHVCKICEISRILQNRQNVSPVFPQLFNIVFHNIGENQLQTGYNPTGFAQGVGAGFPQIV